MKAQHTRVQSMLSRLSLRAIAFASVAACFAATAVHAGADEAPTLHDRGRMHDASAAVAMPMAVDGRIPANAERELPQAVFVLYGDPDRGRDETASAATNSSNASRTTFSATSTLVTPGTSDLGSARNETQRSHFESGKGELLVNDRASLDRIANLLRGRSNLRFRIIGHTDSQRISKPLQKTYPDNYALGLARRGVSVRTWACGLCIRIRKQR